MIINNKVRMKKKQSKKWGMNQKTVGSDLIFTVISKCCKIRLNRPEFMNKKGVAVQHNNVRQLGWEILMYFSCSADLVYVLCWNFFMSQAMLRAIGSVFRSENMKLYTKGTMSSLQKIVHWNSPQLVNKANLKYKKSVFNIWFYL